MQRNKTDKGSGFASLKSIWKRKLAQVQQPSGEGHHEPDQKVLEESRGAKGKTKEEKINTGNRMKGPQNAGKWNGKDEHDSSGQSRSDGPKKSASKRPTETNPGDSRETPKEREGAMKKKKKPKREHSEPSDHEEELREDVRKQKKQKVDAGHSKKQREAGSKTKVANEERTNALKHKNAHKKNTIEEDRSSKHAAKDEAESPAAGPRPFFPFRTDESDHAETPFEAYEDVSKLLKSLAKSMGKKPKDLRIYDPYYCGGTVKKHFSSLGFPRCYNEMEDFYDFAERGGKGPGEYDVTNPPYSADHVERLFKFCAKTRHKPAFLLLPHFFYTEAYFKPTLGDPALVPSLFFLCPGLGRRYRYQPPTWASISKPEGADDPSAPTGIAPFPSFWYCLGGPHTKALVRHFRMLNEPAPPMSGSGGSAGHEPASPASRLALYQNHVFVVRTTGELPNELKSEFDLGRKRPNPKARKKLAKIRQEMSGGEGPAAPPPSSKRSAVWRQRAQQKRKEALGSA